MSQSGDPENNRNCPTSEADEVVSQSRIDSVLKEILDGNHKCFPKEVNEKGTVTKFQYEKLACKSCRVDGLLPTYGIRLVKKSRISTGITNPVACQDSELSTSATTAKEEYHYFVCLTGACGEKNNNLGVVVPLGKTAKNTSKGTKHMLDEHGIESEKTINQNKKKQERDVISEENRVVFKQDCRRWLEIAFSVLAAMHGHSFASYQGEDMKMILTQISPFLPQSVDEKPMDIRKGQVEEYCYIVNEIKKQIEVAKVWYKGMPFANILIDLYKNPINNKKFVGVRLSWAYKGKLISYLLAMRAYDASFAEIRSTEASTLLQQWVLSIMESYGIKMTVEDIENTGDLLAGTGDSGPDVKKCMNRLLNILREWCGAHLLNLCLVDGFGGQVGTTAKCTNPRARDLTTKVKRVIETINKTPVLLAKLRELKATKIVNSPSHRWSSIYFSFQSVFVNWSKIRKAYNQTNRNFDLELLREAMLECHAVISAVRIPLLTSQKIQEFSSHIFFMQMVHLYTDVLDKDKGGIMIRSMESFEETSATIDSPFDSTTPDSIPQSRASDSGNLTEIKFLSPSTIEIQTLLRKAVNKRFFHQRYHPILSLTEQKWKSIYTLNNLELFQKDESAVEVEIKNFKTGLIFEMQILLNPVMKSFFLIKRLCEEVDIHLENIPKNRQIHPDWYTTYVEDSALSDETEADDNEERVATTKQLIREYDFGLMRKMHAKLLQDTCQKEIRRLCLIVATNIATPQVESSTYGTPGKNDKLMEAPTPFEDMLSPDFHIEESPQSCEVRVADKLSKLAQIMVDQEMDSFRKHKFNKKHFKSYHAPHWWAEEIQVQTYPCLSRVACALYAVLPGSGALECDIGCVSDIVTPKRGSLESGLVEVAVMQRVNKKIATRNTALIPDLGNDYVLYIPRRPEEKNSETEYNLTEQPGTFNEAGEPLPQEVLQRERQIFLDENLAETLDVGIDFQDDNNDSTVNVTQNAVLNSTASGQLSTSSTSQPQGNLKSLKKRSTQVYNQLQTTNTEPQRKKRRMPAGSNASSDSDSSDSG